MRVNKHSNGVIIKSCQGGKKELDFVKLKLSDAVYQYSPIPSIWLGLNQQNWSTYLAGRIIQDGEKNSNTVLIRLAVFWLF